MTLKECYKILGVAQTAKLEDVKRAYRRRAFELHPDLNPNLVDASRQFQLLNEAHVNLTRILLVKEGSASAQNEKQGQKQEKETHTEEKKAEDQAKPSDDSKQQEESAKQETKGKDSEKTEENAATDAKNTKKRQAADEAYARQEEVLRDILNDQFARRVFEDIYSEINKKQSKSQPEESMPEKQKTAPNPATKKKFNLEWGNKVFKLDLTDGVGGAMRSWMRRQIDDDLTVSLPRAKLFPGARVRLQIRQGLSNELRVVEVTLPADFRVGKAIRLKGMGKKLGKWTGDLYLTVEAQ